DVSACEDGVKVAVVGGSLPNVDPPARLGSLTSSGCGCCFFTRGSSFTTNPHRAHRGASGPPRAEPSMDRRQMLAAVAAGAAGSLCYPLAPASAQEKKADDIKKR